MKLPVRALVFLLLFALAAPCVRAEEIPQNPLVEPIETPEYVQLEQNIVTYLLLGTDLEYKTYAANGGNSHSDAILLVVVNYDTGSVDLLSFPRDTFTYISGYRGVYKLNAAINVGGEKTPAGFQTVCDSVSYLLGGVKIDYYCSVDFDAMAQIGDAVGGVDFDVDVSYSDDDIGANVRRGFQHLNGREIAAYLRARMNASSGTNDKARVIRQKNMIAALFQQVQGQDLLSLTAKLFSLVGDGLHTNMTVAAALNLAALLPALDMEHVGMHTLAGKMINSLGWSFSFIVQDERQATIKALFGLDVEPLPYCSYDYSQWLKSDGLDIARSLYSAAQVIEAAEALSSRTRAQQSALEEAVNARNTQLALFNQAAWTMSAADTKAMNGQKSALKAASEALKEAIGYEGKLHWSTTSSWPSDPGINEVFVNFR